MKRRLLNAVCDSSKSSQYFVPSPSSNNECPRGYVLSVHAFQRAGGLSISGVDFGCFSTWYGDCEALDEREEQVNFTLFVIITCPPCRAIPSLSGKPKCHNQPILSTQKTKHKSMRKKYLNTVTEVAEVQMTTHLLQAVSAGTEPAPGVRSYRVSYGEAKAL